MQTHAMTPDMAHQALVDRLHGLLDEFAGMPKIEKICMLGQVIGHLTAELPPRAYSSSDLMASVALNIASGNQQSARTIASAIAEARRG